MRDYISIGSTPVYEDCVQVQEGVDYLPAMRKECQAQSIIVSSANDDSVKRKISLKEEYENHYNPRPVRDSS